MILTLTLGMSGEMELAKDQKLAFEVKFVLYFDKWPQDVRTPGVVIGAKGFVEKTWCLTETEILELESRINDVAILNHFKSGTMHSLNSAASIVSSHTGLHHEGWPYRLSSPQRGDYPNTMPIAITFKATKTNFLDSR